MSRHRDVDPAEAARAVARAGRSRLARGRASGAVDLSLEAIQRRQKVGGGGMIGAELIDTAREVFDRAQQLQKIATARPPGRRRDKASRNADDALRHAALQIRVAERCPLGRGYLHALDLPTLQTVEEEVSRAFLDDPAALAVDTYRRIRDQRNRLRAEGATA